jgi:hypothetical protein
MILFITTENLKFYIREYIRISFISCIFAILIFSSVIYIDYDKEDDVDNDDGLFI